MTSSEEIKANLDWYINQMDKKDCSRTIQLPRAKVVTFVNKYLFGKNEDLKNVYYRGFKIIPV